MNLPARSLPPISVGAVCSPRNERPRRRPGPRRGEFAREEREIALGAPRERAANAAVPNCCHPAPGNFGNGKSPALIESD